MLNKVTFLTLTFLANSNIFISLLMHISQIVIDGFKCYTDRVIVRNLDKSFNAIIGMNGCGKSNIIDAIIFCLDLCTSKSMRVSNLKELINTYKTKATVILSLKNVPNFGDVEVSRSILNTNNVVKSFYLYVKTIKESRLSPL